MWKQQIERAKSMNVDWTSLAIMAGWLLVFGVMPFVLTVTDTPLWHLLPFLR